MIDLASPPRVAGMPAQTNITPGIKTEPDGPAGTRGYGKAVQDHFQHPRNVGRFDVHDPRVGSAQVGTIEQGGVIRIQLQVDQSGIINDTCFKAYGCGATIAAASWLSDWAKGKHVEQISTLSSTEIVRALSLAPVKMHCAMLAEDAIKAALADYTQKQE